MEQFTEKIAQIKIVHDDDRKTEFSQFYGISQFPITFDLLVSITFLNLIPGKNYELKIEIATDTTSPQIILSDVNTFSVPEKDMILIHNSYGQAYITTGFKFNVHTQGAYRLTFFLNDNNSELAAFTNYYYFGGSEND